MHWYSRASSLGPFREESTFWKAQVQPTL